MFRLPIQLKLPVPTAQARTTGFVSVARMLFPALVLACLACPGCSRKEKADAWPQGALAKVGEAFITQEDLRREIELRKSINRPVPEMEKLLDEMIDFEALVQKAYKDGLPNEPSTRRLINNLVIARWKDQQLQEVVSDAAVSEEELKNYYQANLHKYSTPGQVRLSLLMLEVPKSASDTTRAEAIARLNEAKKLALEETGQAGSRKAQSQGFARIAPDYSDEQTSRYRGGDIGWLETGNFNYRWPREVLEAGFSLPLGSIGEVITVAEGGVSDGVYLVRKTDERPSETRSFESVKNSIAQILKTERARYANEEMVKMARESVTVQRDDDAIAKGLAEFKASPQREAGTPQTSDQQVPSPVAVN